MSAEEFAEWAMLQSIEPWGGGRLDVLSALQQHAALAPWTKGKINLGDLIPKWGESPQKPAASFAEAVSSFIQKAKAIASGKNSDSQPDNHTGP